MTKILQFNDLHASIKGAAPSVAANGRISQRSSKDAVAITGKRFIKAALFGSPAGRFYNSWKEADLLPQTSIHELHALREELALSVQESDVVIPAGDLFDLSFIDNKRGDRFQATADELMAEIIQGLGRPSFPILGNADLVDHGVYDETLAYFRNELGKGLDDSSFQNVRYEDATSNFAFEADDCLVVGISSLVPGEGEKIGVNSDFVEKIEAANKAFLKRTLENNPDKKPVLIFTHHNPFDFMPGYIKPFGTGAPVQTWIMDMVEKYSAGSGVRCLVSSGHCHQSHYASSSDKEKPFTVEEHCVKPFSLQNNHIGSLLL